MVGVCDSKSMVAITDVLTSEFRDDLLLQLCEIKSNGSSLLDLTKTGEFVLFICNMSKCAVIVLARVIDLFVETKVNVRDIPVKKLGGK